MKYIVNIFTFNVSTFLWLDNKGSMIWGRISKTLTGSALRTISEAMTDAGLGRVRRCFDSSAVETKAQQIPQGGSSGVGRDLQRCPWNEAKDEEANPLYSGIHWDSLGAASGEKSLRSLQPVTVPAEGLSCEPTSRQLSWQLEERVPDPERHMWEALHNTHYNTNVKEFYELFSKTVLLILLLIFMVFILFYLLVHTDMSILFTKRYSMGFL